MALIFLCGALVLGITCLFFPTVTYDGLLYLELAKNIPGDGFVILGYPHQKFLPLYPAIFGYLDYITGGSLGLQTWAYAVNVAGLSLASSLAYAASRSLGASRVMAAAAAAPLIIGFVALDQCRDVSVMPLYTCLVAAVFFFLARRLTFVAGLFMGLAATTRYEIYLFIPFLFIANSRPLFHAARAFLQDKDKTGPDISIPESEQDGPAMGPSELALTMAGFIITASPWWIRNLLAYDHAIHTKYFTEIFYLKFHLAPMAWDLIKYGGLGVIAALAGIILLKGAWRIYLGGYVLLYLGVHVFWWWYDSRFILAAAPPLTILAAKGLDAALKWTAAKLPASNQGALKAALASLALFPVALWGGSYLHAAAKAPADPLKMAEPTLRSLPPDAALMGGNFFLLYAYSGHMAYTWEEMPEGHDPHRFVLDRYESGKVRFLVWSNYNPNDSRDFGFLADGLPHKAHVNGPGGFFIVYYFPYSEHGDGARIVRVYEVKVKKEN